MAKEGCRKNIQLGLRIIMATHMIRMFLSVAVLHLKRLDSRDYFKCMILRTNNHDTSAHFRSRVRIIECETHVAERKTGGCTECILLQ